MNTWTQYRPETGEVIGWSSGDHEAPGPDFVLSPVGQPGNPNHHYVADGELRTYTGEEQAAKDSLPTGWTWLLPDRVAVDMRALGEAKAKARSRIDMAWIEADSTSFTYAGKTIDASPDDIVRINSTNGYVSLIDSFPDGWPGGWKTTDNSYVSITDVATWKLFYTAFVMQGQNNFKHAQILKEQIDAVSPGATANEQLDAIQWAD